MNLRKYSCFRFEMVSDDAVNLTMKPTTESTTDADVDADKDADAATTVSALTTAVDIVTTDISITSTGLFQLIHLDVLLFF